MRAIMAGVVALVLAGCGTIRYTGTEEQMQEVARGAAELMKKNPYSDTVSGAGAAAHMALAMTLGKPQTEEARDVSGQPCVQMFSGCYVSQESAPPDDKKSMDSFTGLPKDFYKATSIGKD